MLAQLAQLRLQARGLSSRAPGRVSSFRLRAPVHPLLRKLLSCMQCGGIIKTNLDIDGCLVAYGCRVKRVQNWERSHIVSFYSRLFEEFGASRELRYLLKDSLACTIRAKHRLLSRSSVYALHGPSVGGFPMRSEDRPAHFRTERPAPRWVCSHKGGCPIGHRERVVFPLGP